jgi:metal-responsive CopG/Arc/MetJ family transcriptional regulator
MPKVGSNLEKISIRVDRDLLSWLDSQSSDRSTVIRRSIEQYQAKKSQVGYARMLRDRTKPS